MKKIVITFIFNIILIQSFFAQNSANLTLLGSFEWSNTEGSDIWGWVDASNNYEYALVGLNDGFSVVNVTSPTNPVEMFYISDLNSKSFLLLLETK